MVNHAYVLEGGLERAQHLSRLTKASSKTFTVPKDGVKVEIGYDEFVLAESMKDCDRGWCTPPLSWSALRQRT